MSKQSQKNRPDTTLAATPAAAPAATPVPDAVPQAATPAAAAAHPKAWLRRVREAAQARLAGSRAERFAALARERAGKVPVRFEAELDSLLDRVGLVRKSRGAQQAPPTDVGAPASKAA